MANISNNDIAEAIYFATKDKQKEELPLVYKKILDFLKHRNLLSKSGDILNKLEKILNLREEKILVKVSSAKMLNTKTKETLIDLLKTRYKAKEVLLEERLDEGLVGGMKLEINDEIIDLTVKDKLKKLQEHLTKRYE